MFWVTRLLAFVLSIFVGVSLWLLAAKLRSGHTQAIQTVAAILPAKMLATIATEPQQEVAKLPSIEWSSPDLFGYTNVKTLTLRDIPDADASVVSKFKLNGYEPIQILDSSDGEYVHVHLPASDDGIKREQEYEGWAAWGSVVPYLTAIVLDTETGAVVRRIPLSPGLTSLAYSPDGSRATFYSRQGNRISCEVRTSDYTITTCFSLNDQNSYNTVFYGPSDGELYAAIFTRGSDYTSQLTKLKIVRVSDRGASSIPAEIPDEAEDFAVAPNGRIGFILHREDKAKQEMVVDVLDLSTFKMRNSFTLHGTDLPSVSETFAVNRDGAELYARLYSDGNTVSVIDTRTGNIKRVLSFNPVPKDYWYFDGGLVGDSLLLRIWNQDQDEIHTLPHVFWLGNKGRVAAQKGIYLAAQADDVRYAINEHGTKLFKLDSDNRIRETLSIDRPELRTGLTSEMDLGIFALRASPDGKRLILFVGVEDGC